MVPWFCLNGRRYVCRTSRTRKSWQQKSPRQPRRTQRLPLRPKHQPRHPNQKAKSSNIPKEIPGQSGRGNIVGTSGILPEVGCEAAPSHVHLGIQGGSKPNLFSCKRCGQPVSVGFPCNARGLCLIRMPTKSTKLRKDRLHFS